MKSIALPGILLVLFACACSGNAVDAPTTQAGGAGADAGSIGGSGGSGEGGTSGAATVPNGCKLGQLPDGGAVVVCP